jgi:hypothetical protein
MIVYDLTCSHGHRFEGWFGSSADYEEQRARGLIVCPYCGTTEVGKAPMAPAVPAKSNQSDKGHASAALQATANMPMPAELQQVLVALAKAQTEALRNSTWVGDRFAEESRAMFYGEREEAPIHGQATLAEAKALVEEGVPVTLLPFPVVPPENLN